MGDETLRDVAVDLLEVANRLTEKTSDLSEVAALIEISIRILRSIRF